MLTIMWSVHTQPSNAADPDMSGSGSEDCSAQQTQLLCPNWVPAGLPTLIRAPLDWAQWSPIGNCSVYCPTLLLTGNWLYAGLKDTRPNGCQVCLALTYHARAVHQPGLSAIILDPWAMLSFHNIISLQKRVSTPRHPHSAVPHTHTQRR